MKMMLTGTKIIAIYVIGIDALSSSYVRNELSFVQPTRTMLKFSPIKQRPQHERKSTELQMSLDMATFLRTEFVSTALFTNQIPRASNNCLQLGTYDGRIVNFIPRTIQELLTSTVEPDGSMPLSIGRQLKQQNDARNAGTTVRVMDQRADDLTMVDDDSVDCVITMQSMERMRENGLDWKKSIMEAGRVLKPGGRFLFCEQTTIGGESFLEYVTTLACIRKGAEETDTEERFLTFDEGASDDVDFVLVPHVAGIAVKAKDAGMTKQEKRSAELEKKTTADAERNLEFFEFGRKKRRIKKKKQQEKEREDDEEDGEVKK
mmetsp:Transcript_2979/g.3512  ORF Transcript_2979/g.3512 Transcript_2979/m.3512 type:complete len:319 (-) Transcript_2979:351-1307(-)